MINKNVLRNSIVVAGALALSACGGGSSGSNPVVVVPPPPPPPVAAAPSVTVTGFVTDMPIANATVIITVDGQQFTAPNATGADGSFSVDIESDNPDAMVICEAFDPNGPTRFSALLNNFAGLQEDAGDDDVATDVNITNVTTAQFILAQELATDGTIDDIAELQSIAEQIDPDELLELAAAIKVVVDSVAGVTLPAEFADVQELAQAIVDNATTFLADIEVANPGILDETIIDVVEDGFATVAFSADSVPGVYVDTDGNNLMLLNADGTGFSAEEEVLVDSQGTVFENQLIEAVSWTITDTGALQIVFLEAQDIDTATLLNDAGGVLTLYVSELDGISGAVETGTFSVVRFGFDAEGFDAATVPGSYNDPEDEEEATEFAVFLANGTGYGIDVATGVQDEFFTWEVNAAGELLLTDDGVADIGDPDGNDDRSILRLLEGSTADSLILLSMEMDLDSDAVVGIEAFPVTYTSEIITGPMPDMANTLLLEGKTYAYFDGQENGLVTFGENGVFSQVRQDFDEVNGPEWEEGDGEWFVDDNATLHITFVEADGVAETDLATVVSGLGEDSMVVLVDDDGVNNELVLTRVLPIEAAAVVGTWQWNDLTTNQEDTAVFNADGSGTYSANGIIEDNFEWSINADGTLVVVLSEEAGVVEVFTDNYHMLADSTPDNIHAVVTFRLDGVLVNDAEDAAGPPQAVIEATLLRLAD